MTEMVPVHVWLPGEVDPVQAGTFTHDPDRRRGEFRYAPAYLESGAPSLAPDMPRKRTPLHVISGKAIFPLLLDAGPDTWGRHLLARREGRDVSEFEALSLCPADGVGNLALGELTEERQRVLSLDQFLDILRDLEAGGIVGEPLEERVLDAVQNGTSLGGTKPKLTLTRGTTQYLAKFPEPGDSRWLPHLEHAMLRLARACNVNACEAEVWDYAPGRSALLVARFDREAQPDGWTRKAYVSAHAMLRLDMLPTGPEEQLALGGRGFTRSGLRKSYVSLAADMARWCGGRAVHLEERRELWRRIVFNALINNLDDHARNHGFLCHGHDPHVWRLSPAFDLVAARAARQGPSLALAYRYVPPARKGRQETAPRLITRISAPDLLAAAVEHYGYEPGEASDHLQQAATTVHERWRGLLASTGMPAAEVERYAPVFAFAAEMAA